MHKSGFVNIIGTPNVGKSTLMNALMGDKLSIITSKPQTTRHRILGIMSDDDSQVIFSDSPGLIENPAYELQNKMNKFAYSSFEDADVLLFVIDLFETYTGEEKVVELLKKSTSPKILIINKIDLAKDENQVKQIIEKWKGIVEFDYTLAISALENAGVDNLKQLILELIPEGPVYYPKDQITDKPERFFVSEIIREKILEQYKQEVPYSCEVIVESFKEDESRSGPIINISAIIYVDRKTQKSIIIGKGGSAIKQLGTASRLKIEEFFNTKVFLEMHVSVKEGWRSKDRELRNFGYDG